MSSIVLWSLMCVAQAVCFLIHFLRIYTNWFDYALALLREFIILIAVVFCTISHVTDTSKFTILFMVIYLILTCIVFLVAIVCLIVSIIKCCIKRKKKRVKHENEDYQRAFNESWFETPKLGDTMDSKHNRLDDI